MRVKCTSFEEMRREISERDMSVVVFGAGVIGTVTVPEILRQYGLLGRVAFYIDNSPAAWERKIVWEDRVLEIKPVDELRNVGKNTAVLIAVSRYAEILAQLEQMSHKVYISYYIIPMMNIHNFCSHISEGAPILSDKPLIPKIIHYMWLGKKQIPSNLQKCIDSWKKYCPDYEIIRWDENNYDVEKHAYMKAAYEKGAYGFVPDYARLDILYRHGGIYMDTDVEVIKNLDLLLYQEAFCGVEKWQVLNFGGCSGAIKGHRMIGAFLKAREDVLFLDADGRTNTATCGFYDTNVALKYGYQINGTTQNIRGMNIYAFDYFHPYDYMSGHTYLTEHTYAIHRFNGGWLDEKMKRANQETMREYDRIYELAVRNGGCVSDGIGYPI